MDDPTSRSGEPEGARASEDRLIRADAAVVARSLPAGALDLVYLDPPFGTGRVHRTLRGRGGRFDFASGFRDPVGGFPDWLEGLLRELPRVLRPGGAVFLHVDWRSSHRARLLLDDLFGPGCFLNEIIWHYATGGIPTRWLARKHDTILYYRNGEGHTFHRLREKKYLAHRMCRRGVEEFRDEKGWFRYRSLDDVWEIPWLTQDARERTGYPTQKPEALLERILRVATDPGDRVADFCCGSGTTAAVARRLGRRWIACDASVRAVEVARRRLESMEADGGSGEVWPAFAVEHWPGEAGFPEEADDPQDVGDADEKEERA